MAPNRWGRGAVRYCVMEALARTPPRLGRYVREFLGSDLLVVAHGECAWSRAYGCAGPSRGEIGLLWNSAIRRKLAALLSTPRRCRCGGRSYDFSFSNFRINCLDRVRFHWCSGAAPLMDQS